MLLAPSSTTKPVAESEEESHVVHWRPDQAAVEQIKHITFVASVTDHIVEETD